MTAIANPNLNLEEIRRLYHYNPDTGHLTYKVASAMMRVGDRAGCPDYTNSRNRRITYKKKCYLEHRIIWFWVTGIWPDKLIDHVNGNPLDNRWLNLRLATHSQNGHNKKVTKSNSTGVKGVSKSKNGKFKATINLGSFNTVEEAKVVYDEAARKLHGEFFRQH